MASNVRWHVSFPLFIQEDFEALIGLRFNELYGLYFVPSNGAVLSSTLHTTIFVRASSTLSYTPLPLHTLPYPFPSTPFVMHTRDIT